jgi:hypothetical protein
MKKLTFLLVLISLFITNGTAWGEPTRRGLNPEAMGELVDSGVTKYTGEFTPVASTDVGDGWVKHTFDPDGGDGPICIAGTPFSAFSKDNDSDNLLIMLQGGGACWQDFYFCNILAEDQEPPPPPVGIWADSFDTGSEIIPNPIGDWSIVYMPYCDGSVFSGDNDVVDANFPFGPVRFHRGLRNVTAGIDLAKSMFPSANRIMVAGSSAGGAGAAAFAPFLARFAYGNTKKITVFNDAGPVAINLLDVPAIQARAADWDFGKFYPASCTECDDQGQATAIIQWRLDNDSTIREAFYSTDGDATNRFFLKVPTQGMYRALIVSEHGKLHDSHPNRYQRFIRSGDDSHTALQTPLFYLGEADGVPLDVWTGDFLIPRPFWIDIVEDFVPLP